LSLVWKTMYRAVLDILYYFLIFVIMFVGFLLCGFLAFGPHLREYRSVTNSASTLLRMVIGEIDYASIRRVNPSFAWVFFAAYVLIFFFLLVNIFLAIILDAWHFEADRERAQRAEGLDLRDELKSGIESRWDAFKKGWRSPRYWRDATRAALRTVRGNAASRRGFLSDAEVLARLQEWRRKRQNRATTHLTISALQNALEGPNSREQVAEAQLVDIFQRCSKYLVSIQDAQRMAADNDDDDDDPGSKDMNMAELKKLQSAIGTLEESQRRTLSSLQDRLDALRVMQQQTVSKVDFLDGQVKKIVPHFAD
jgi:hypothetical protein